MTPEQYTQHIKLLTDYIQEQASQITDDAFDYGYALGKLQAHYEKVLPDIQYERFSEGLIEGFKQGHVVVLQ